MDNTVTPNPEAVIVDRMRAATLGGYPYILRWGIPSRRTPGFYTGRLHSGDDTSSDDGDEDFAPSQSSDEGDESDQYD